MAVCHHGLQHSLSFFGRRVLQKSQSRTVASAARKPRPNQPKKIPKVSLSSARTQIPKQQITQVFTDSTIPPKAPTIAPRASTSEFPENLLVYQSSSAKTATIGFIKMTALLSFAGGTINYSIQIIADENQSNWKVLNTAAWCLVPAVFIHVITAPYVAYAYLHLPFHARASLASLKKFASSIPDTAPVTLTTMQFLPWRAHNHTVTFGELHKLPPAIGRLANVEYRPTGTARQELDALNKWGKLKRRVAGSQNKFFVPLSDLAMKKSRAPGIWQTVFEKMDASPRGV